MKAKDIRTMDTDSRAKELVGLLREQFNLRMQHVSGQLGDFSKLRKIRRNIARMRTVMNEKTGTGA